MEIAIVGLGRMGSNMSKRLLQAGHRCLVYDRAKERRNALEQAGAEAVEHLDEIPDALESPRTVWVMLPAGAPTESTIQRLAELLSQGDIIIDGGNTYYKDDIRRALELEKKGIRYLDVGTSGGVWGLERGYCLMIGGDRTAATLLDPIFRALAPGLDTAPRTESRVGTRSTADWGYLYCGKTGAGHFVKMIHNGIEYGMMQSFAEGFEILRKSEYSLDLAEISEDWRRGSVVSSWLLDLIAIALNKDPDLDQYEGIVQDSGEGRWTVQAAIDEAVPAHIIASSLFARFRSRDLHSYADKLLSAMRSGFGGHVEPRSKAS